MRLQGRNLTVDLSGDDVGILHTELIELGYKIPEEERNKRFFGEATREAVLNVQKRQGLSATGIVEESSAEKLTEELNTIKKKGFLKVKNPAKLQRVVYPLRHNMTKEAVISLQKALAYFKLDIDSKEVREKRFGKTTMEAVKKFQSVHGLDSTGEFDKETARKLNHLIAGEKPESVEEKYRVRGSVRDDIGIGRAGITVELYEKTLRKEIFLQKRTTLSNGFFDILYNPPKIKQQVKENFHIIVKILDEQENVLDTSDPVFNVKKMTWVNFSEGSTAYRGNSEYEDKKKLLKLSLGSIDLAEVEESNTHKDISFLSVESGLPAEDIMKIVLSHKLAEMTEIAPEVFFAFIRQGLPPSLPGALIESTQQWLLIDELVETCLKGIAFLDTTVQKKALESAIMDNYIPQRFRRQIEKIFEQLKSLKVDYTLKKPILGTSMESLLKIPGLNEKQKTRFTQLYIENQGPNQELWTALDKESEIFGRNGNAVRLTFEIGNIVKYHKPTIELLLNRVGEGKPFSAPRDLAKLSRNDWEKMIMENIVAGKKGYPNNIEGTDEQSKIMNYVSVLKREADQAFPTIAFAAEVARGKNFLEYKGEINQFIDKHPDLDLKVHHLDRFLKEKGKATLAAFSKPKDAVREMKMMQRALKLAPTVEAANALLENKLHSSTQIYSQGKERFVKSFGGKAFSKLEAEKIFDIAASQHALLLARVSEIRHNFHRQNPKAMQSWNASKEMQEQLKEFPSLEVLFGPLNFCDCKHCRSVYSPAAYLVDILRFLHGKDALDPGKTARDVLFKRRPDIGEIELSCENTNLALPYVDLVNEVLENAIAPFPTFSPFNLSSIQESSLDKGELSSTLKNAFNPPLSTKASITVKQKGKWWEINEPAFTYIIRKKDSSLRVTSRSLQSTGTAVELSTNPQYINRAAYEKLRGEKYPWSLPFDLCQEEARTYLTHLGVKRHELMEAFFPKQTHREVLNDKEIACECLGLTSVQREIITSLDSTSPWKLWGLQENVLIPDPVHSGATISRKWHDVLSQVDIFLHQSKLGVLQGQKDLGYRSLLELLDTRFINPLSVSGDPVFSIRPIGAADSSACSLDKLMITADAATAAQKEKLLIAFYGRIYPFVHLARALGWTFRDLDKAFTTFQPSNLDDFLLNLSHIKRIGRKLKVSLTTILSWWSNLDTSRYTDYQNDVQYDSLYNELFRNKTVNSHLDESFALNSTGTELLYPHSKTEPKSITAYSLDVTSALGIKEADLFLLIGNGLSKSPVPDELNLATLSALHRNISLAKALKLSISDFIAVRSIITENPFNLSDTAATLLFIDQAEKSRAFGFTAMELAYLLQDQNTNDAGIGPSEDDITRVLEEVRRGLQKIAAQEIHDSAESSDNPGIKDLLSENFIVQTIGNTLHLEETTAKELLTKWLKARVDAGASPKRCIDLFLEPAFVSNSLEIKASNFSAQFRTYVLLHKVSMTVTRFKATSRQLAWVFRYSSSAAGWLDLNTLPAPILVTDSKGVTVSYERWLGLVDLFHLRDILPMGETVLEDLFTLVSSIESSATGNVKDKAKQDYIENLSKSTGWSETDLTVLLGQKDKHIEKGLLGALFPSSYNDGRLLLRLSGAFSLLNQLGISARQVEAWVKADLTDEEARSIKHAAKGMYDEARWLSLAKPLRDDLREKQRAALVAYLAANPFIDAGGKPAWHDIDGLYAHFLIDVEMKPNQMTSRIKQAISSVQLFVQRCLMNLEANSIVTKAEDAWGQWKWMKNYRVWEANRKVFLYPENWIEPGLRDDKTPFFSELENEILQKEITHENVEEAFLNYLEKLDQVAKLEVCGLYHELDEDTDIVHVFARSKASPPTYYYRKYVDNSHWTAWEKLEIDIVGEHLIPVVFNRKLHLFWPVFSEKASKRQIMPPAQPSSSPGRSPEPAKHLEIQLAWSVLKNGKWTAKKVSRRKLIHTWQRPLFSYNFRPRLKGIELWVDVFLSTSREFNDERYYIPQENAWNYLTETRFDETARPWHSSSFVFNGDVIDIKMKDLKGSYSSNVHVNFGEDGRLIRELNYDDAAQRLLLPPSMHFQNASLVNNTVNFNADDLNVVMESSPLRIDSGRILDSANSPFALIISQQDAQFNSTGRPFFYQDQVREFFIKPVVEYQIGNDFSPELPSDPDHSRFRVKYTLYPFYHPYTNLFIRELNRLGLDGLFNRKLQTAPESINPKNNFDFVTEYRPVLPNEAGEGERKEVVDFSFEGAYSTYNWELFFHAPLLIASKLSQNQRFEEAMRWFHYIFDPTTADNEPSPQRYWITQPFYLHNNEYSDQRIDNLLKLINSKDPQYEQQVEAWRKNPFSPHLIARLRPVAYQRTVVMKYLDNLIAWGDQLFQRDTIESINEATLLYVLAAELLGPRPEKIPALDRVQDMNYNELEAHLDAFGNALVEVENVLPPAGTHVAGKSREMAPTLDFYFCIPNNDKLLEYWGRVEDRLFKIRHSMNIDGIVRQLPLFEPPIDPALLVKAAAAGLDLGSVLDNSSVKSLNYRFRQILQKAQEFSNEVKSLGSMLLSVLEKGDSEALSLLRSAQEKSVLEAVKTVRLLQIQENGESIEGLWKSRAVIEERKAYYESIVKFNTYEQTQLDKMKSAHQKQELAQGIQLGASLIALIPDLDVGASGFGATPVAKLRFGGLNLAQAAKASSDVLSFLSLMDSNEAARASTLGGFERRWDDWQLQLRLATKELVQIDKQIAASEIRKAIAEQELSNQELQIENSKVTEEFMLNKYTNRELYDWMLSQISAVYFQSYQLAFDMAKRAEQCFRFELGIEDSSYIQSGYWSSLKKGLLAGEKLSSDLRRMEAAYLDMHRRELEITKHISLAQVAPQKLALLKESGSCTLDLPEWLFDMDYPGHYMRRIMSLSISIPCVAGSYTSINCTLSLIKSETRVKNSIEEKYDKQGISDDRFNEQYGSVRSIATSNGQNDSGMFQLNFSDDRYLPFEGHGVISTWQIDMPQYHNQFDFNTISDAILHVQYTSRDGGYDLRIKAKESVKAILPSSGVRLLSLKHEFPNEWHRFTHPTRLEVGTEPEMVITIQAEHFPFYTRSTKNIKLTSLELIAHAAKGLGFDLELTLPAESTETVALSQDKVYGSSYHGETDFDEGKEPLVKGTWTLKFNNQPDGKVEDLFLILYYKLEETLL